MTRKTIELIESKGYKLYKTEINEVTKKHIYYFKPNILKDKHYEIIVKYKKKNNEHELIELIADGQGNIYKSYIIEDVRNTNTFKSMLRKVL